MHDKLKARLDCDRVQREGQHSLTQEKAWDKIAEVAEWKVLSIGGKKVL